MTESTPSATSPMSPTPSEVLNLLRQGRQVLLVEGIICLVGGFLAIVFAGVASLWVDVLLGVLCVLIGVLGLIRSGAGGGEHRGSTAFSGVLLLILGALLLIWPFEGLQAMTLVLAIFSLLRGLSDLLGVPWRSTVAPGLQVLSGCAGLLLGILLLAWYPSDALWAPGLLFGMQLIMLGMMLMALWNAASVPIARGPVAHDS